MDNPANLNPDIILSKIRVVSKEIFAGGSATHIQSKIDEYNQLLEDYLKNVKVVDSINFNTRS